MEIKLDNQSDFERFKNLSFGDFKKLAKDDSLSIYQKIGFPDDYRKGKESDIFQDIHQKMAFDIDAKNKVLLDIGPGCSELPLMILEFCAQNGHQALLVDSKEMLSQLPSQDGVYKYEGYFPDDVPQLIHEYQGKVDYIIAYSVFHYVFYNTCIYKFIDRALSLLKPGGKFLIGDIPNISKRNRFFLTEKGINFHKEFTRTNTMPEIKNLQQDPAQIDDGLLMGIMQRYRGSGFDCYLLPQIPGLPMENRREDLLICKI
jgi:hypothetical protein